MPYSIGPLIFQKRNNLCLFIALVVAEGLNDSNIILPKPSKMPTAFLLLTIFLMLMRKMYDISYESKFNKCIIALEYPYGSRKKHEVTSKRNTYLQRTNQSEFWCGKLLGEWLPHLKGSPELL